MPEKEKAIKLSRQSKTKDTLSTLISNREKLQIFTFEKLDPLQV